MKKKRKSPLRTWRKKAPRITAVDVFCGVGGLTHGLAKAGIHVKLGVDIDPACEYPYKANNRSRFLLKSVVDLDASDIDVAPAKSLRLLAGCAPCQPFSSYSQKNGASKGRWRLLREFERLAALDASVNEPGHGRIRDTRGIERPVLSYSIR